MEQKEYLDLSCRFARRKFYDKEKKKYTHYISGETVVDEEKIRFKLNDKDSRLFQYMLKKMGLKDLVEYIEKCKQKIAEKPWNFEEIDPCTFCPFDTWEQVTIC